MFSNIRRKLTHPRSKPNSPTGQCSSKKGDVSSKKNSVEFIKQEAKLNEPSSLRTVLTEPDFTKTTPISPMHNSVTLNGCDTKNYHNTDNQKYPSTSHHHHHHHHCNETTSETINSSLHDTATNSQYRKNKTDNEVKTLITSTISNKCNFHKDSIVYSSPSNDNNNNITSSPGSESFLDSFDGCGSGGSRIGDGDCGDSSTSYLSPASSSAKDSRTEEDVEEEKHLDNNNNSNNLNNKSMLKVNNSNHHQLLSSPKILTTHSAQNKFNSNSLPISNQSINVTTNNKNHNNNHNNNNTCNHKMETCNVCDKTSNHFNKTCNINCQTNSTISINESPVYDNCIPNINNTTTPLGGDHSIKILTTTNNCKHSQNQLLMLNNNNNNNHHNNFIQTNNNHNHHSPHVISSKNAHSPIFTTNGNHKPWNSVDGYSTSRIVVGTTIQEEEIESEESNSLTTFQSCCTEQQNSKNSTSTKSSLSSNQQKLINSHNPMKDPMNLPIQLGPHLAAAVVQASDETGTTTADLVAGLAEVRRRPVDARNRLRRLGLMQTPDNGDVYEELSFNNKIGSSNRLSLPASINLPPHLWHRATQFLEEPMSRRERRCSLLVVSFKKQYFSKQEC
ncbi:unnamed protein product [Schistosoma turkestanicum]|nr:unnamed protein product [Schistosoma turkestanicum]